MSYLQHTLLKDERILYSAKPHWVIYGSAIIVFAFACFAWWLLAYFGWAHEQNGHDSIFMWIVWLGFIAAAIQWIRMWIFHRFSDYGVTNKRAIMKKGWISRDAYETFLERIEGTRVDQSILGRMLGYGTLIVIGTGGTPDSFPYIPNVLQFRHQLQQAMDQANKQA